MARVSGEMTEREPALARSGGGPRPPLGVQTSQLNRRLTRALQSIGVEPRTFFGPQGGGIARGRLNDINFAVLQHAAITGKRPSGISRNEFNTLMRSFGLSPGQFNQGGATGANVSGVSDRQQRAAATNAARAAATRAARKRTPSSITRLPSGGSRSEFTPFKGTDLNVRDNVYAAARCGRLRTVRDMKSAASNIQNVTFRAKLIAKAQRLALAAIRAGR